MSADDLLSVALDGVAPRPEAIRACAQLSQRLAARTIELLGDGRPEPVNLPPPEVDFRKFVPPAEKKKGDGKPRRLASKYDGRCRECGGHYSAGDMVLWTPGEKGAVHDSCA